MSGTGVDRITRLNLVFLSLWYLFPPLPITAAETGKRVGAVKVDHEEASKHRLTKPVLIHEQLPPEYTSLNFTLCVIVDKSGKVESAKAMYVQPSEKWAADEVEAAEKQQRFTPFTTKRTAVKVEFEDPAWIVPPVEWASPRVPFPEIHNWDSLRIGLRRTGCYGMCPTYSVEVQGSGLVLFNGEQNVLITGRHRARISREAVAELFATFRNCDYFSLKDKYEAAITDLPTVFTSIEFEGQKKSVKDYVGFAAGMPEAVTELESKIDRIAGTDKWIRETPETASSLVGEQWDFQANTPENLALFNSVIEHRSSKLVNLFIEHGAPVGEQLPGAVSAAAIVGNTELLERFVGSTKGGHNVSRSALSCALTSAAQSGSVSSVRLLITKGADPTGSSCDSKSPWPPLVAAAASGNPAVVSEILRHHPDVNARDASGDTAILATFHAWPQTHALEILRLLIRAGADVNVRNGEYNPTGIFKACDLPDNLVGKAISMLAKAGADLAVRDDLGRTALDQARASGDTQTAALLEAEEKAQKSRERN